MKVQVTYRLHYKNRNVTKAVNIRRCLDKTHAETKFFIWARKKYINARQIDVIMLKDLNEHNIDKNSTVNRLKEMFGIK